MFNVSFLTDLSEFQESFKHIPKMLRGCSFPDEGELKLFDYYSEANCKLECSWKRAEETCGCKPWYVPSTDGTQTCFVLGNICFDQTMNKIQRGQIKLECGCDEDCVISRYTLSVKDKTVLERLSVKMWPNDTGGEEFFRVGTDELDGNDFSGSHWYNMGKTPS